ncbi:MAG TPA: site-2 protease family protein [Ktedonobacteraceae bacterium]|nr:site-2 protease family protein [Ktedonobacteraceae bacterium]
MQEIDYANPQYYQQIESSSPLAVESDQTNNRYHEDVDVYAPPVMSAYSGPKDMSGYTVDIGAAQREAAKSGKIDSGKQRKRIASFGGLGTAIIAFVLNIKWLVIFGQVGLASISAVISVFAYSFFFGWPFAIGLVVLLFLHEMGHALVMKLKGIPVGGLIFVPMLGAAVFMKQMPKNAKDEAEVGIAGPIAGAIASAVCLFLALQNPNVPSIWVPLAYFGFFMNLFNLIPIVPFDGGRVLAAIDRRIWVIGFLGLLAFEVWSWFNGNFSPWLLFFIIMAGSQFLTRHKGADTPEGKAYYNVPVGERVVLSLVYFGLAAVLVLGMSLAHGLIFAIR